MDKVFVILGGNMLLRGINDKLKSFGYYVVVIDWNESPAVKGDEHIRLDVKDSVACVAVLKERNYIVDGAISCIDLAVPTVNAINKAYGLKTMPESFMTVLSKIEMRTSWEKAGLFNRISKSGNYISLDEIVDLNTKYKIIIKPDVAASSRGITIIDKNSDISLIREAVNKAKAISFDNNFLVEEFVTGQEFTVDMLGDETNVSVYGISVKYHSANANRNRVAVKLHWNSNVYSDDIYNKIAAVGKQCYKAIGLKNSFGHLEVIMKEDGTFTPVEIGARSSGFIASHLVSAASEKDYLWDYIQMLHGHNIENKDHINGQMSSMWFGYDIPAGTICSNLTNLTEFLDSSIEVMYSNRDGLILGHHYSSIIDDNGRDKAGYEMLKGPKDRLTIDSILKSEKEFINKFGE